MQIFNFHDGHVTTFWHPLGTYICQMPGQSLQTSKSTLSASWLSIGTIGLGLVKLFSVGCAQDSRRVL